MAEGHRSGTAGDVVITGAPGAFVRGVDALSRIGLYIAMLIVLGMMTLVCVEILLRNVFHYSLLIVDEVVGNMTAAFAFFAISYALREGALLRVDVIFERLAPAVQAALQVVYDTLSIGYVAIVFYFCVKLVLSSIRYNTVSVSALATPMWIPQSVLPIGGALLILALAAEIVRNIYRYRALRSGGVR